MWDTLEEWRSSGYTGSMHLRNRVAGGSTYYDIPVAEVESTYRRVGASSQGYYLAAMAPTSKTLIQGEVQRTHRGLELHATTIAKPMREALSEASVDLRGIISIEVLKVYLCPSSYDWLNYLLGAYPDHVVEFSTYGTNWGTLVGYNTVFWEVRNY